MLNALNQKCTNWKRVAEAEQVLQIVSKKPKQVPKSTSALKAVPTDKKKVKFMPEKKFKALRFKVQLNITVTKEDRETYKEQCVLRKLKRFLG